MNILIITVDFLPRIGGIAAFNHGIAHNMQKRGHKVFVLAPFIDPNYTDKQNYEVIRFKRTKNISSFIPFIYTFWIVLIKKIDIILLGHALATIAFGALLIKKIKICRLYMLVHGADISCIRRFSRIDRKISDELFRNSDLIFTNSRYTLNNVERLFNLGNKIKILNPGVDLNIFNCNKFMKNGKKDSGDLIVLSVTRLVPEKGVDDLINAFSKTKAVLTNIKLYIVGDGILMNKLKRLVNKLSLTREVVFTGRLNEHEIALYLNKCDLFVLTSKKETFGIVLLEAGATGKAILSTKCGGIPEVIVDNVTGILVEPGNIKQMSSAMTLLLRNKKLRDKMGDMGRKRIINNFTWENITQKLENYLKLNEFQ
jgi:glycosyltransferase involved in cell wall biosynthesis